MKIVKKNILPPKNTPYDVQKFLHRGRNNHQILKYFFFPKSLVKIDVFLSPNLENKINNDRHVETFLALRPD